MISRPPTYPYPPAIVHPWSYYSCGLRGNGLPVSATLTTAAVGYLWPLRMNEPFVVAKAFWANGATVGTDSIDMGVYQMTDQVTGRVDLIRSTGLVLSAGVSIVQAVSTWRVAANAAAIADARDSTDSTTYTTASVTLKAGRLYLLSFVNTAADAAAISSIAGGPTWTSRATTQYNGTAHRVSLWSGVPTADYTGTIVVTFGATQTAGRWALNEFSGVNTATTDGVVQTATGTGNSTTPLATLAAFGSANNATFGANANTADSTTTPGAGFTELSDLSTSSSPAAFLQTQWRVDNDTTSDGTITSGQWGAIAAELKADASPFVIPPSPAGIAPDIYMSLAISGTTATILNLITDTHFAASAGILRITATGGQLPTTATAANPGATQRSMIMCGFSSRTVLD
jgi:hypothetical protein